MRIIETEELKKIQLDILADVHKFCVKNGIKYSLAFGSLLGAVRHKGYIPWDDDIDIMMLRRDYDKFLKTYGNKKYKIANQFTMASCYLPYSKVFDVRTLVREFSVYPMDYGVNIDVFPLDNVPDSEDEFHKHLQRKRLLNIIYNLKVIKIANNRSFLKNVFLAVAQFFLYPVPIRWISKKMRELSVKYSSVQTERIGIIAPSDNNVREIWKRQAFNDFLSLPFEDIEVLVIKNYHDFLTAAYGNYMQLPPKDKRVSHHVFSAFWKG